MTREEWCNLKPGDVIRWMKKDGTYWLRTVIDAPKGGINGGNISIHVAISRRSWTGRIHTVLDFNTNGKRCFLHDKKEDRLMTDMEMFRLCDSGFDIPKQLHREIGQFGCLRNPPQEMKTKILGAAMLAKKFCPIVNNK